MEDFFVQECCVHGTDLENHGPTSILCDDPLPIESNVDSMLNGGLNVVSGREIGTLALSYGTGCFNIWFSIPRNFSCGQNSSRWLIISAKTHLSKIHNSV